MRFQTRRRDTNPQVETAKPCLRNAPKPKTEKLLARKFEDYKHNCTSGIPAGKSTERAAAVPASIRVSAHPAGPKASDGWADCHDGGRSRPGSARRPVGCKARAGSGPAAGPGAVEARWGSRLGRVRPGRGPGHSGGEEKQPTGQRAAVTSTDRRGHAPPTGRVEREPRGRAQWRRGGAADWVGFGPAAGPGAAEARRSSRRAGVQQ